MSLPDVAGRPSVPGPLRCAVVGDPVGHSASPRLFAALGRALGLALEYGAVRVTPEELPAFLGRARAGAYHGLSVTLPHKVAVLALADAASPVATAVGAANCLRIRAGTLEAHNTDSVGLVRALAGQGVGLGGARVLVLGAGGAARAALHAARTSAALELYVCNRTPARAETLAAAFAARAVRTAELSALLPRVDVLVQASAAGLDAPGESPLPGDCVLHPRLTVLDMVYQPLETELLRQARAVGARAVDGLWMLVHQALEQCRLWTGVEARPEVASTLHQALLRGAA